LGKEEKKAKGLQGGGRANVPPEENSFCNGGKKSQTVSVWQRVKLRSLLGNPAGWKEEKRCPREGTHLVPIFWGKKATPALAGEQQGTG